MPPEEEKLHDYCTGDSKVKPLRMQPVQLWSFMEIEFFAKEKHFEDHLAPVAAQLEEMGVDVKWVRKGDTPSEEVLFAVVASSGDLGRANKAGRMVIYAEHGAGQSYGNRHPSYAGGGDRKDVCLFLSPGPHVDAQNSRFFPRIPSIAVGVPKLDKLHRQIKKEPEDPKAKPVVCFSFHWDCKVVPETRSGFEDFKHSILLTREANGGQEFEVIVHCHPRAKQLCLPFYKEHNLEYVEDFQEVLERADIYVCDNSSTILSSRQ